MNPFQMKLSKLLEMEAVIQAGLKMMGMKIMIMKMIMRREAAAVREMIWMMGAVTPPQIQAVVKAAATAAQTPAAVGVMISIPAETQAAAPAEERGAIPGSFVPLTGSPGCSASSPYVSSGAAPLKTYLIQN